ncbi:ABC1 family-domain-containing protein [Gigaspora rosea]|uniref:ABC1 family-domain-containing protein n=1 Tax=Gigaspora rosea TaxID=44941 RepID=A0A397URP5_9GLOM|nr:ABC1 family-domain-containing protein [Gigaspora rosea]
MLDYKILHYRFKNYDSKSNEYKASQKIVHLRVAKRLLKLCRLHTGIYVKGAQHLASLTFIVPKEYIETLSVLQDRAPYRGIEDVKKIFAEEFNGLTPNDVYSEFDETPIAAASLAQVHKAKTKDGQEVAVKVQYPDVSRLFHVDIWTMQSMSDLISFFFPEFELTWIITEFKQNLISEFDFLREAKNGELTKQRFKHRAHEVKIPNIIWDLTTKRVLTMEFVHGVKINNLEKLKNLGVNPKWVRTLLQEVFSEMIFCHGVIHCDPHAGNALVTISPITNKPQLVILDHGLYRELSDDFRMVYCDLWKALVLNDSEALKNVADSLGVSQYIQFLPLIFTQRIPDSTTPLGEDLTPEERAIIHDQLKHIKLSDFFDFLESLPRDMLLVLRTINIVRGIHRELGGKPIESFRMNAQYAIRGLWCETRNEEKRRIRYSKEHGLTGDYVMIGPLQRWYLLGGTPSFFRTLGFIKDFIVMTFKLYLTESLIKLWRLWYLYRSIDILGV